MIARPLKAAPPAPSVPSPPTSQLTSDRGSLGQSSLVGWALGHGSAGRACRARRLLGAILLVAVAMLSSACVGTPTPLAPGIRGSVGLPHNGVLTHGEELPKRGEGFARFRPHSPTYWGNPRLVAAIRDVAATVARKRPGGAPLIVGDLSARYGGKIPRHRSHRTGRDVDFLFYMTTPSGAPVRAPGFIRFESDGIAHVPGRGDYVRLDVERQWLFVRELLKYDQLNVQFLFVSRAVEAILIDYARARESDLALIWHAETVMLQPGDSAPHDDHMHMRIACTPEEAVHGCEGGGPRWEWLDPLERLETPLDQLTRRLKLEDPLLLELTAEALSTPPEGA